MNHFQKVQIKTQTQLVYENYYFFLEKKPFIYQLPFDKNVIP